MQITDAAVAPAGRVVDTHVTPPVAGDVSTMSSPPAGAVTATSTVKVFGTSTLVIFGATDEIVGACIGMDS